MNSTQALLKYKSKSDKELKDISLDYYNRYGTTRYWFKCPKCCRCGSIHFSQARGISPIECKCGWAAHGLVAPSRSWFEDSNKCFRESFQIAEGQCLDI